VKAARVEAAWRTPNWNAGPTDAKLLVIVSLANRWSMGWLLSSTIETAIVEKPVEAADDTATITATLTRSNT
jgi:hypothetical protein